MLSGALGVVFLAPPAARADEPVEVVVTGRHAAEDAFIADRSVGTVNAKDLAESPPRTTPEALLDTPGVFVQQTNTGAGAPIIRGLVGPQILLMVDGVRLNNSVYRTGPLQYLNLIDPMSLAQIEVLRGPGSARYGSDAMGGVIHMTPIAPRDTRLRDGVQVHGRSRLRFSSANLGLGAHAHGELGVGGFAVLGGGTLRSFGNLRGGGDVGEQPYTGYGTQSAIGSAAYRFGDAMERAPETQLTYLYTGIDNAGRTDKLESSRQLQLYDNDMHLVYDRWRIPIRAIDSDLSLTASFQHFFERKDTVALAEDLVTRRSAVRDEIRVNTLGLDGQLGGDIITERLGYSVGGMFYRDWVDALREQRQPSGWVRQPDQNYPSGSTYSHYAGFAMMEAVPMKTEGGHRLRMRGGYRIHAMAGDAPARSNLPEVDFSHVGQVTTLTLQYLFRNRAVLGASFAQGFRAPNLQEAVMLGNAGQFFHTPNPDLGPERSSTFEVLGRGRLWRLQLSWSAYVSLIDDALRRVDHEFDGQTEIQNATVVRHINDGEATVYGTEAELAFDLGGGMSTRGAFTYTRGDQHRSDGTIQPMRRIPPIFGTAAVRFERGFAPRWRYAVETYFRWAATQDRLNPSDVSDVRIPDGGTPGWWTWNIKASVADDGHHRATVAVENILDEEYRYHGSGYVAPGANAIVSYEASF